MAGNGNFCVLNPLMGLDDDGTSKLTFSNGNLRAENTANGIQTMGTMAVKSGKWYYEEKYDADANISDARLQVGVQALGNFSGLYDGEIYIKRRSTSARSQGTHVYYLRPNYQGGKLSHPTSLSWDYGNNDSGSSNTGIRANAVGDIYMIALDLDNYKFYIGRNGTWYSNNVAGATGSSTDITQVDGWSIESEWQGSFWTPVLWIAGASSGTAGYFNFGQDGTFGTGSGGGNQDSNGLGDFAYSVPSGYLAWNTSNLPISDDIDPAQTSTDFPQKQFATITYTGTNSAQSVSNLGFSPDLVWIKARNSAQHHALFDSSRGALKRIGSSRAQAEDTDSSFLSSFDTDGFSFGGADNTQNGNYNYVAWCWKAGGGVTSSNTQGATNSVTQANTKAGFSITTYTGIAGANGSSTVGHGLTQAPEFIIHFSRTRGAGRWIQHVGTSSANHVLQMHTSSETDYSSYGTIASPSATTFGINGIDGIGGESADYVAYVWHSVEGYSRFSSYIGSGNSGSGGVFCYLGFRPRLLFLKKSSSSGAWNIFYSPPKTFNSESNEYIVWNNSDVEANGVPVDFLSNGFFIRSSGSGVNGSGATYVYGAWGDPFKYGNTF